MLERLIKNLEPAKHPYFITYRNILVELLEDVSAPKPDIRKSNIEVFTEWLATYGFYELDKIKTLTAMGKKQLTNDLSSKSLPYQIAMFKHLGFLEYLQKEHAGTKYKLFQLLATITKAPVRTIKGNINVINPNSKEPRNRYTSHLHVAQVKKDYQKYK